MMEVSLDGSGIAGVAAVDSDPVGHFRAYTHHDASVFPSTSTSTSTSAITGKTQK